MKKLVLAAAIAALTSNAMAVEVYSADDASVEVFGEIRTRLQNIEDDSTGDKFDMGSSKLGVKAKYDINDDLSAGGYLRYTMDLNDGDSEVMVSKGYLWLASEKMGSVAIGKMGTVHDELMGGYDASTLYGGAANYTDDAYGTGSIESAIGYKWSNDSFTLLAQTILADNAEKVEVGTFKGKIDKYVAVGGQWASDFGLTLTASVTNVGLDASKDPATIITTFGEEVEADTTAFGADYAFGAWTVGGEITKVSVEADKKEALEKDFDTWGAGTSYKFENGIKAFAGYDVVSEDDSVSKLETDTTTYNVGIEFWPRSNVKTFVEFANENTDKEGSKDKDVKSFGLGARVYF